MSDSWPVGRKIKFQAKKFNMFTGSVAKNLKLSCNIHKRSAQKNAAYFTSFTGAAIKNFQSFSNIYTYLLLNHNINLYWCLPHKNTLVSLIGQNICVVSKIIFPPFHKARLWEKRLKVIPTILSWYLSHVSLVLSATNGRKILTPRIRDSYSSCCCCCCCVSKKTS